MSTTLTTTELSRLIAALDNLKESHGYYMYLRSHKAQANRKHSRLYRRFMVTSRKALGNPRNGWLVRELEDTMNAASDLITTIKFICLSIR